MDVFLSLDSMEGLPPIQSIHAPDDTPRAYLQSEEGKTRRLVETALDKPGLLHHLDSLLAGSSAIDRKGLCLDTRDEAASFLRHYGYDPVHSDDDAGELELIRRAALDFITFDLLPHLPEAQGLCIPEALHELIDPLTLLTWTTPESTAPDLSAWACAVLKVMHTLAHIYHSPLYQAKDAAREQILSLFYERVVPVSHDLGIEPGIRYELKPPPGYQSQGLPLVDFQVKDDKSLESMLMKLLSKKENVAEELRDVLGVRFITQTQTDALRVVQWLLAHQVVVAPNIIPSRTRNSLLPLPPTAGVPLTSSDTPGLADVAGPHWQSFEQHNPASSHHYRAIHLTSRQLIRDSASQRRVFYPYEIQVTDWESHRESQLGQSAHHIYKDKQRRRAARRVLGPLLPTHLPLS